MAHNNDDLDLQQYQDDFDTDPNKTDDITEEETDNPSDSLLVPDEALKDGLSNMALDELEHSSENPNRYNDREDAREDVEDTDQGDLSNPDQTENKS